MSLLLGRVAVVRGVAGYSHQTVRRSVRASVCPVHCGKTGDRIRMPFGTIGRTGPGMRHVVGLGIGPRERVLLGANLGRAIVTNGDLLWQRRALFPNYFGQTWLHSYDFNEFCMFYGSSVRGMNLTKITCYIIRMSVGLICYWNCLMRPKHQFARLKSTNYYNICFLYYSLSC